ncbi:solute carrier organic anion transporter family member 4C1 [Biomphalaria pfeifferi]|uniref:Solute carrier organic anion transporter family member n=1 Tax=Biomphalaria pfeifferi TaxID=112525 RepID=A0AAD8EWJ4_BIOPF|nr:solute carrier organic anion transporter family member 4C1 [Biomphalaria pfeifferi]
MMASVFRLKKIESLPEEKSTTSTDLDKEETLYKSAMLLDNPVSSENHESDSTEIKAEGDLVQSLADIRGSLILSSKKPSEDYLNRCGYGTWRPEFLQCFNSPNCLVFFMGLYSLVLGFIVNGVHNVNISSIERRFDLDSTNLGFVSSAYDVSAAVLAVVIGYIGSGKRKPRLLAIAVFISAMGSFIMALPHFVVGKYTLGMATEKICTLGLTSHLHHMNVSSCTTLSRSSPLSLYLYVFLFAQLLHGIGGTTLFTVGISLMDDSVIPKKTPLYLGIIYGCNILGSGLGYIIGGQLLNIYVDVDKVHSVKLVPGDTRWLGAWWLGPTLAACLQLIVCIPISLFGSELPGSLDVRQHRIPQAHRASSTQLTSKFKNNKFMTTTLTVVRNPCFVFITLGMTTEGMFLSGTAAFLPKFIENQFGVPASKAAVLSGMAVVPAAVCGLVMGGFIAKKFNFTIRQAIKYLVVTSSLSAMACAVVWIRCQAPHIYGVSIPYTNRVTSSFPIKLDVLCNNMCNCDTDAFEPVCNEHTGLYFSPCYAGCVVQSGDMFHNCSCVPELLHLNFSDPNISTALTTENCRPPCGVLYLFAVLLFFSMCVSFLPIAPGDSVQLRCVQEEHKVYAQGIKTLIVRMLGSFVGPILMGKLLDLQCETWRERCGQRLSCWLYNQDNMVIGIYLYSVSLKGLSVLFSCLALKFYRPPVCTNEVIIIQKPSDNIYSQPEDKTGAEKDEKHHSVPEMEETSMLKEKL